MNDTEKLAIAVKALEWYAKAEPTREYPWKEFGCGCCAYAVKFDADGEDYEPDWDTYGEAQGHVARETLALITVQETSGDPKK